MENPSTRFLCRCMNPATDATVTSVPTDQSFSVKARNMSAFAAVCVMIIHAGNGGMGSFAAKMMHQFFGWGVCTFAVPWFFFASGKFGIGFLPFDQVGGYYTGGYNACERIEDCV